MGSTIKGIHMLDPKIRLGWDQYKLSDIGRNQIRVVTSDYGAKDCPFFNLGYQRNAGASVLFLRGV